MAQQGRKPIPKTQKEISISQHTAYDESMGNPNFAVPDKNNRALQTSFKGDTTKPFSINIQDLDEAVFYYFENIIKPFVIQNELRIPVPVIYGSPEKWKSYQKDGYYRDLKGKGMSPLIVFKRTSLDKNKTVTNKLDANNPLNYGVATKQYSPKNSYDNFSVLNNTIPEKTYYAIVVPDFVTATYECVMFTYYVEQMNKLIEMMQYASDSYWGEPERFKFKVSIDSFTDTIDVSESEDRIVKSTFTFKLAGHLIPDTIQKDLNSVKKFSNRSKLSFTTEVVSNIKDIRS
jgi:hypothetical protein